jgi:putative salt-induced outer membrane protein YdiY
MSKRTWITALGILLLAWPALCPAQEAEEPVKAYTGNIGAGLSLTSGNTDTVNFNVSGELTYDPKTKNVMKFNGLYLRASANNVDTTDRLTLRFRDEYSFSERILIYGEMGYLRDPFKDITYLLNPQGGIGFKAILTEKAKLTLSAGAGSVWEKNPDIDVNNSATLNAGEDFSLKLSDTASFSQNFSALWKTSDFEDALYHFSVALVTSITSRSEVKLEFIDDFKNVTPDPDIKKNDMAFIVSFLYKI